MKKKSVIGAALVAAAVLCAAPISIHLSQDKGLTLSVDKARARIGRPLNTHERCWRPPQTSSPLCLPRRLLQLSVPRRLLQLSVPRSLLSLSERGPLLRSPRLPSPPLSVLVGLSGTRSVLSHQLGIKAAARACCGLFLSEHRAPPARHLLGPRYARAYVARSWPASSTPS